MRHAEWRDIATEFVATRRGTGVDDLVAIAVGQAVLAATLGAHQYWIAHPEEDIRVLHERYLRMLLPDV